MTELEKIEAAENQLVSVPWKGSPCFVKLRELDDLQIQAIGNFSLIETEEYKWSRNQIKTSWSELLAYAEKDVKICMAALVSPSYDEIFNVIGKNTFNAQVKANVENINMQLQDMPPGPARQELEQIRDSLVLAWEVILPADFMTTIVTFALRINNTDIKRITEDMLFGAAVLAERGNKAPHEYINGAFSTFNVRDIDTRAWIIYDEKIAEIREQAKSEQDA